MAIVVGAILVAMGAMAINTRRKSTIKELANIFGQTVEMLASVTSTGEHLPML